MEIEKKMKEHEGRGGDGIGEEREGRTGKKVEQRGDATRTF